MLALDLGDGRAEVVSLAAEAAASVQLTGSARLRTELKAIPGRATGWSRTPQGRQLRDIVASVA